MTVEGERKQEKEEKGKKFHKVERSYGKFVRRFALPTGRRYGGGRGPTTTDVRTVLPTAAGDNVSIGRRFVACSNRL